MKHIFLLLLMLGTTFASYTQTIEPKDEPLPFKPKNPRPTDTGEENNVWYTYANGLLTINFEQPEGRATMTVARMEDAHIATTSFFTMAPYTYNIGTAPGTYTIVVKTSHQEYEALLEIN